MRKSFLTFLLVIGVVALIVPGIAMGADINTDVMTLGDDYTRTWQAGSYNAWDSNGPSTSAGAMWGGWDWAAQFIAPCPQWLKIPDAYGGKCNWDPTVNTDYSMSSEAQTKWGLDADENNRGTIVDDLYSRVVDHWLGAGFDKGVLDQDLDILFGRLPNSIDDKVHVIYEGYDAHTTDTYIDQAIDQQLAYWEDLDIDNQVDVNTENGLTQRLVNDFAIALLFTGPAAPDSVVVDVSHLSEGFAIDQWVVQWLRDIDTKSALLGQGSGKEGIDQLYSSWFELDETPASLGPLTHTYRLGHETITKDVTKGTHDHDPNGGTGYNSTGTGGTVWDP